MNNILDLTGQRFGKLLVIKRAEINKKGGVWWLCKCDCGKNTIKLATKLKNGLVKSCGCLAVEKLLERNTKHNLANTRIYKIYKGIIQRCYSISNPAYKNYGGRGIIICDEWLDKENGFMNFYNWAIKNGYQESLSIDRIDVNGNYEPSNCKWATFREQCNNRRTNHYITYKDEKHTIAEWSNILGISYSMLKHRLERNWDIEKALFYPHRKEIYNENNSQ